MISETTFIDIFLSRVDSLSIDDEPIEIIGTKLSKMKDAGQITLYPATYRLVYDKINQ